MILTRDLVYSVQSENGGWNKNQLQLMGVQWPLVSGWIDTILQRSIPDEHWEQVKALAGVRRKVQRKEVLNGQKQLL
jgi:hypothetical protein